MNRDEFLDLVMGHIEIENRRILRGRTVHFQGRSTHVDRHGKRTPGEWLETMSVEIPAPSRIDVFFAKMFGFDPDPAMTAYRKILGR